MLPATVWMLPAWPVGVAARAVERTPTPLPAASRPATTVARPRRVGTARRRFSDWNIVLLLGFEECLSGGTPRTPGPASGRAEATVISVAGNRRAGPRSGRELSGVAFSARPFDPFRVEGFL